MSINQAHSHILTHLQNAKSLTVSERWLSQFLTSMNASQRTIPLSALTQTALFRILASDFTESLSRSDSSALLPVDISDPAVQERRILGPVPVQVLDIDDIGSSLWSQVEAIERVERGEAIRGREIIRTVNVDDTPTEEHDRSTTNGTANTNGTNATVNRTTVDPGSNNAGNGPHRLVLQDAAGTNVTAIELKPIDGIGIGKLPIGAKMVLRNATVARGMVLLEPECVTLLGGKVEAADKAWKEGLKGRLVARLEEMQVEGQNGDDRMEE
ncbi:hypothetical protein DTO027B5_976 [Paecilomyces variotii]|nr:hypothetical protein DTO169C6_8766 [Paecilomyces variotii]KAJ9320319.1 hypothetical protein DTO027B3_8686 [Paecilomyces variotii]KAJ9337178.1 hypothetical protein DTO027B5_976 [Paecilomyces variotii]KAJ9400580.1 hypothetical protein DTO282F9_2465 [Paecilomyces variotii]